MGIGRRTCPPCNGGMTGWPRRWAQAATPTPAGWPSWRTRACYSPAGRAGQQARRYGAAGPRCCTTHPAPPPLALVARAPQRSRARQRWCPMILPATGGAPGTWHGGPCAAPLFLHALPGSTPRPPPALVLPCPGPCSPTTMAVVVVVVVMIRWRPGDTAARPRPPGRAEGDPGVGRGGAAGLPCRRALACSTRAAAEAGCCRRGAASRGPAGPASLVVGGAGPHGRHRRGARGGDGGRGGGCIKGTRGEREGKGAAEGAAVQNWKVDGGCAGPVGGVGWGAGEEGLSSSQAQACPPPTVPGGRGWGGVGASRRGAAWHGREGMKGSGGSCRTARRHAYVWGVRAERAAGGRVQTAFPAGPAALAWRLAAAFLPSPQPLGILLLARHEAPTPRPGTSGAPPSRTPQAQPSRHQAASTSTWLPVLYHTSSSSADGWARVAAALWHGLAVATPGQCPPELPKLLEAQGSGARGLDG